MRFRLAALLAALLASGPALARNCVGANALKPQPISVVPEPQGGFSYLLRVENAGGTTRNFSTHFPLPQLMPPPDAVYSFNIRPRQTIVIQLGSTQQRASDEALRRALRITCHS
jgi:hypothetical protein